MSCNKYRVVGLIEYKSNITFGLRVFVGMLSGNWLISFNHTELKGTTSTPKENNDKDEQLDLKDKTLSCKDCNYSC